MGQCGGNDKEYLTHRPEMADCIEDRISNTTDKPEEGPADKAPTDEAASSATGNEYAIPNVTGPEAEE